MRGRHFTDGQIIVAIWLGGVLAMALAGTVLYLETYIP
jgi:hypothetical protein